MNPQQKARAVLQHLNPYVWGQPCPECGGDVKFFYGHRTQAENQKWLEWAGVGDTGSHNTAPQIAHRGRHYVCEVCAWIMYDFEYDEVNGGAEGMLYQCPLCCLDIHK